MHPYTFRRHGLDVSLAAVKARRDVFRRGAAEYRAGTDLERRLTCTLLLISDAHRPGPPRGWTEPKRTW